MADDGAEFSIDLDVKGGAAVDSAAVSLAALADKLTLAGAASTAASDAMKAGQNAYGQAEAAADRAAKSLEKIGLAAEAQRAKLAALGEGADGVVNIAAYQRAEAKLEQLNQRQSEAAAKAASTASAMNAAAASLDTLKGSAAAAADNEARLAQQQSAAAAASKSAAAAAKDAAAADQKLAKEAAGAAAAAAKTTKGTDDASKAAGGGAINFRALGAGLGKLGGPLGSIGSSAASVGGAVQKLGKSLGAAGPYVAAAVLAVALAAAFVVAGLAITKFAVASADTARTSALLSDGIAGSVQGGRELDASLERLGNTVPLAREELMGMASDLSKSGLKGKELTDALETAAVKAAKLKFGPDFAKQMLSLDNQGAKLKSNITGIFSGLKIEGLLEGLAKLVALFDSNSETGKALKVVFESLFQPIVDGLTGLIPKFVTTFIQIEILAMKAMIAIKPWGSTLQAIGYGFVILGGIVVAIVAIAIGAVLLTVAAFALLMAIPFLAADAFKYLGNAASDLGSAIKDGAVSAFDWLSAKVNSVIAFLSGLSLSQIGSMLIQGLVDGITGGGASVLAAITGIAGGAVDAAKKALGIASPSKVFAEIGMHTAAGMAEGVDGGAGDVKGSMESMVAPPAAAAAGGSAAPAASGGGGGPTYYVTVQAGGGDATSIVAAIRQYLESLGAQMGTAVPDA